MAGHGLERIFLDNQIDVRLEKLYDVFVGTVIYELFDSRFIIDGLEKCNIKSILQQCVDELKISIN